MLPPPLRSTLFPYTTLFRSLPRRLTSYRFCGRCSANAGLRDDGRTTFMRSEEHTSELQSLTNIVCRLLLGKKNQMEIEIALEDELTAYFGNPHTLRIFSPTR